MYAERHLKENRVVTNGLIMNYGISETWKTKREYCMC